MRSALAVALCGLVLLAGCGSVTSAGSNPTPTLRPPMAVAGGPYAGTVGSTVSFSGTGSSDPQGQTLTFAWNFGDGGTGIGASTSHTYLAAGAYTVSLTVTNTSGLNNTATVQAIVGNVGTGTGNGVVYDGQQPILGAHVYLFAANTTGYGQPSVSLLKSAATGHSDSIGAYVLTASDGSFVWTGDYTCTPGTQVYVYALGGTTSAGTNSASGMMAALGTCPNAGSFAGVPYIGVNEVSTIAAAYAFAGFATDATHVSSSGTALAQLGIANAFANAANLSQLSTGVALAVTPAGNGTAPQRAINTLANILAACVNTSGPGSSACVTLFSNALPGGSSGSPPTDTATAAIYIAHNPGSQIAALYSIPVSAAPFSPVLFGRPTDFTVSISFTGAGVSRPVNVAVDGSGNVWATDILSTALSEVSSTGVALSSFAGYSGGGMSAPAGIAIDLSGNAWVANRNGSGESEISSSGAAISPATGFLGCAANSSRGVAVDGSNNVWITNAYGCVAKLLPSGVAISPAIGFGNGSLNQPLGIAIDGAGAAWIANQGDNSVTKLSSSGALLSPPTGLVGGGLNVPDAIAIDGTGNAWVVNAANSTISEFSNAGTVLSPSTGYVGGGLYQPEAIAIDGAGNVWAANYIGNSVSEFSNAGNALSPAGGYTSQGMSGPDGIAVDGSGNVWVAAYVANSLVEFVGAAAPVVTPLAVGVKNNALGTRP